MSVILHLNFDFSRLIRFFRFKDRFKIGQMLLLPIL